MKLHEIHPLIQAEMSFAQVKQQKNVDQHRNLVPAYQVEDLVWLNTRIIITCRPSIKLDY
jgi:hypothetical protein